MKKQLTIDYLEYASAAELDAADAELLTQARLVTQNAYAPYSNFYVGAAARLISGEIHTATNQENASFAVTMCAEQTLFMGLTAQFKQFEVSALAVSFANQNGPSNFPISPCGKCRQFLLEFEKNRNTLPIRVIMSGQSGIVHIVNSVADLIPLAFSSSDLIS